MKRSRSQKRCAMMQLMRAVVNCRGTMLSRERLCEVSKQEQEEGEDKTFGSASILVAHLVERSTLRRENSAIVLCESASRVLGTLGYGVT